MADGIIKNICYARQRADFNGMRFGTITPTDIDGFVEFRNQAFVFIETKHGNTDLPQGQRLALERVCDRVQKSGAEAMVLVLRNEKTGNDAPTYLIAPLLVIQYRYKYRWHVPNPSISAYQAIEKFRARVLADPEIVSADPRLQSNDEWLQDYERRAMIDK